MVKDYQIAYMGLRCYREFMKQGLGKPTEIDYCEGGLIRSYGGWQHLRHVCKEHERKVGDERILGDS